jgi:hypothetical protein
MGLNQGLIPELIEAGETLAAELAESLSSVQPAPSWWVSLRGALRVLRARSFSDSNYASLSAETGSLACSGLLALRKLSRGPCARGTGHCSQRPHPCRRHAMLAAMRGATRCFRRRPSPRKSTADYSWAG